MRLLLDYIDAGDGGAAVCHRRRDGVRGGDRPRVGGPHHIIALALKTAWLCVRRSFEVRDVARDAITEARILWSDLKNLNKPKALIQWPPELRATIDEVLAIKRNDLAGSFMLFGNLQGQRYTKSGWGKLLGS